jgi:hypothetical protein
MRPSLPPIDRYHLAAITHADELDRPAELPLEIRYVLAIRPERKEHFRALLGRGYGLAIRTVDRTPERVLKAVDLISHQAQENTLVPWLPQLLREERVPVFLAEERERLGDALDAAVQDILSRRYEFKKIVLVDLENMGLEEEERAFMREVNRDLYPLAVDYIVNRVQFDAAHTRTEVAQNIIKALIVVGPIAHALEHVASGVGKLFAASADDILGETAELFALRGSGFAWGTLARRSYILLPVFALATWGALSVEGLIHAGHVAVAGIVFGASAVALSLTTAIQSIGLYRGAYARLRRDGKLPAEGSLWGWAFRQDFSNPARLGLFLGAFCAPVSAALVFVGMPSLASNGWVLALLGSVESLVAGITVLTAQRLNRARFRAGVRKHLPRGA